MTSALVSGALATKTDNGGNAWSRLSWLTGLRRLGLEVAFVEQIESPTEAQRGWLDDTLGAFGFDGWIVPPDGPVPERLRDIAAGADLLLNIGGHLTVPELFGAPRRRVYLDDDPGYTQYWHAAGSNAARLDGHDLFFTFGANVGGPGCPIPTGGIAWRPTRPPVVLDDWPVAPNGSMGRFTTIATWRGPYGRLEVDGRTFGLKLDEFRRVAALPDRCAAEFELALDIHPAETADLAMLAQHGWRVVDPQLVARTPAAFRDYVQGSSAEFSAAQGVYVETDSGWFSDRTVRYLASGRPALVQETGFSRTLPTGDGLVAFTGLGDAEAGVARIVEDYAAHAKAARKLAEEYFDSDLVVGVVLEDALA